MNRLPEPTKIPYDPEFLDKLPAGVVVLFKNKPVFINEKVRKDLRIAHTKSLEVDFFLKLLDPSERERFLSVSMMDPLPEVSEWKAITFEGNPTWIQLRITPLDNDFNLVIIRNIGKVKKILAELSATEKLYQALIERAPNFLFIFKNGEIGYYNQAFIDKLGYAKEEIDQKKSIPTFLIAPEDREKVARFLIESKRRFMTGAIPQVTIEPYQLPEETSEFDLLCKDGSRIPVYAIIKRFYYGKEYIIQGVLIDLSAIKELNDMKFDFLTLSQHQLRTPLANMKGHLDYYLKRIQVDTDPEEKASLEMKLLTVFKRNINQMMAMIDDLNDIAAIRHGRLKCHLRGEDFIPVFQQSLDDLQFLLNQYRIHTIVEYPSIPLVVNLDRNRISQALRNVLENAIRFTGHGTVEIRVSTENNNLLKLIIKDDGVGINPTQLEDIGKPFITFHPSASRLGLGLYLTKQIIEDHNGSFEITSNGWNKGTIVTIKLPLLVSPIDEEDIIETSERLSRVNQLIESIKSARNTNEKIEIIQKLGNGKFRGKDLDRVISVLEQLILYEDERTIRDLASKFYSKQVNERKKATSDVI